MGRLEVDARVDRQGPVHPHACGEISAFDTAARARNGTSPRLWGDCLTPFYSPYTPRYIPTPVGRLPYAVLFALYAAVHPHACGEIALRRSIRPIRRGTSPRLWGDSRSACLTPFYWRYIPTPVGRFIRQTDPATHQAVHPHACGEISRRRDQYDGANGTSPRLWGDWARAVSSAALTRYIPTPVGRLATPYRQGQEATVHPHACGEILSTTDRDKILNGTSPRLWGDSYERIYKALCNRYIPTPVGRLERP